MAVPKRKVSPSRRNMRRSHHALPSNSFVEDKETGELVRQIPSEEMIALMARSAEVNALLDKKV